MKSFLDLLGDLVFAHSRKLLREQRDRIEDKDTELDCAFWWIDQQAIAIKKEKEQFAILSSYVDRMASAIAGTDIKVFDSANPDKVLEDAIGAALEQQKQLLYARTKTAKTEHVLEEMKEIISQMSYDSTQ